MIAIVDNEELEKRKASRIPQNTWIVGSRVNSEWAEERNNLFLIIGDSKTVPQVNLILRDFEYHW